MSTTGALTHAYFLLPIRRYGQSPSPTCAIPLLSAFLCAILLTPCALAQSTPTHVIIDQLPAGKPHVRVPIDDCADPGGKISGTVAKGENLIKSLQPEEALAACDEALQTKCSVLRQQAQLCAVQAIQEKQTLAEASQQLKMLDFYLTNYMYDDAERLAGQLPNICCEAEPSIYQGHLRTYVGLELQKRVELKQRS